MAEIAADQNVECVICMQSNNNLFFRLACGHGDPAGPYPMHKGCLRQHFQTQVNNNYVEGYPYVTCPICRQHPSMQDIQDVMNGGI
jgi:hypothetical protein